MSEMLMTIMTLSGRSSHTSRHQPFWIDDDSATRLAVYAENGRVAMAVKDQHDWTSVYLAAPTSLGAVTLNNIARRAGAYVCGDPGQSIFMSGNFVSLHGMRSGAYTFRLPPGTTRVIDPDTREIVAANTPELVIPVQAQATYWYVLE